MDFECQAELGSHSHSAINCALNFNKMLKYFMPQFLHYLKRDNTTLGFLCVCVYVCIKYNFMPGRKQISSKCWVLIALSSFNKCLLTKYYAITLKQSVCTM